MSSALDWLRDNEVATDDVSTAVPSFAPMDDFNSISDAEKKSREMENALGWMRGSGSPGDVEDTDDGDFDRVGGVSAGPMSEEQRKAQEMSNALDWLKNNNAAGADDEDLEDFSKYDTDFSVKGRSHDEIAQERERALDWLRDNPSTIDDTDGD